MEANVKHQKKKRVARLGANLSNSKVDGINLGHDIIENIMREMDSKDFVSYQLSQEVSSRKKREASKRKALDEKESNATETLKKLFPKKSFPLMKKCQTSLKYLEKNICIPKPRAHVGRVTIPQVRQISQNERDLSTLKCNRKRNTKIKVQSKAYSKIIDSDALKNHPRLSTSKNENAAKQKEVHTEVDSYLTSSDDGDAAFENFLQNVNENDSSSTDNDTHVIIRKRKKKHSARQKKKTSKELLTSSGVSKVTSIPLSASSESDLNDKNPTCQEFKTKSDSFSKHLRENVFDTTDNSELSDNPPSEIDNYISSDEDSNIQPSTRDSYNVTENFPSPVSLTRHSLHGTQRERFDCQKSSTGENYGLVTTESAVMCDITNPVSLTESGKFRENGKASSSSLSCTVLRTPVDLKETTITNSNVLKLPFSNEESLNIKIASVQSLAILNENQLFQTEVIKESDVEIIAGESPPEVSKSQKAPVVFDWEHIKQLVSNIKLENLTESEKLSSTTSANVVALVERNGVCLDNGVNSGNDNVSSSNETVASSAAGVSENPMKHAAYDVNASSHIPCLYTNIDKSLMASANIQQYSEKGKSPEVVDLESDIDDENFTNQQATLSCKDVKNGSTKINETSFVRNTTAKPTNNYGAEENSIEVIDLEDETDTNDKSATLQWDKGARIKINHDIPESPTDELDIIASKLTENLNLNTSTILNLLALYEKEYKDYSELVKTGAHLSTSLKDMHDRQVIKLKHLRTCIKNVAPYDPCCQIVMEKYGKPSPYLPKRKAANKGDFCGKPKDISQSILPKESAKIKELQVKTQSLQVQYMAQSSDICESVKATPDEQDVKPLLSKDSVAMPQENLLQLMMNCICSECGQPATATCQGCNKIYYCSSECGIKSWHSGHSRNCKKVE